ncbi:MAG: hypothetical protein WDZ45_00005 [Flavobacteriaceae bacterium]
MNKTTLYLVLLTLFIIVVAFVVIIVKQNSYNDPYAKKGLQPDQELSYELGVSVSEVFGEIVGANGYDLVHLQTTEGEQVLGSSKYAYTHTNGVNYWFISKKNATTFVNNPEQYLPKFNGFCAWGMVKNLGDIEEIEINIPHTTPSSPSQYVVINDKNNIPITLGFFNTNGEIRNYFMKDRQLSLQAAREGYSELNGQIVTWRDVAAEIKDLKNTFYSDRVEDTTEEPKILSCEIEGG